MARRAEHISALLSALSWLCSTQEAQDFQSQIKDEIEPGDLCILDV